MVVARAGPSWPPAHRGPMTRASMEVRNLNKRLSKRLKAKAAVNRAVLSKQLFQGLLAKSLLKARGLAIRTSTQQPVPLPWLALLVQFEHFFKHYILHF